MERIQVGPLSGSQREAFAPGGTIEVIAPVRTETAAEWIKEEVVATYRIIDSGPDWLDVEPA